MSEIFHQMANHYDTPDRIQLATTIRSAVEKELSEQTYDQKLIDYGGGTGLVTLPLASRFKELIIMDSAAGMLAMADKKNQRSKTSKCTNGRSGCHNGVARRESRYHSTIFSLVAYSRNESHFKTTFANASSKWKTLYR